MIRGYSLRIPLYLFLSIVTNLLYIEISVNTCIYGVVTPAKSGFR